ncbi:MAG: ABC transporter ATP-binding protein [Candidatus Bathyarchaeia archaeon]
MDYAVETSNLTKVFTRKESGKTREVRAVDGVNLKVRYGEFFGLLGPNGAGKTTLIKMLATIMLPTEGTARVNGYDVVKEAEKARSSFGWLHGETGGRALYWRLNAEDNLRFYAYLQNVPRPVAEKRIDALLDFFELREDRRKMVKDYSTGMKVRVMLARSLLANPPILFMDEPTVGLDTISAVETRALLQDLNRELGKTILFTSHNMYEVERLCERVAIMRNGRIIIDDAPSRLSAAVRDTHAVEVRVRGCVGSQSVAERMGRLSAVRRVLEVIPEGEGYVVRLEVDRDRGVIASVAAQLEALGVGVVSIGWTQPTLEDVFVKLTRG